MMRYNIRITTIHECSSGTLTVQSTASLEYLTIGTGHDIEPCRGIQTIQCCFAPYPSQCIANKASASNALC